MQDDNLKQLEEEVRNELGIKEIGPNMSTHDAGKIGGYMVKKLIERAERMEINKSDNEDM